MAQSKNKAIDLGALQDHHNTTKKQHIADSKALEKARDSHDRSRKAYLDAAEALKAAARTVLD